MVIVISDTCQEFLGERYWLCGFYFQRRGRRLHRTVWEHHNGPIPDGWHVHHVDEDRSHNQIENLDLVRQGDHLSYHSQRSDHGKAIAAAQDAAREWHGSKEGWKWHSQHAKKVQSEICKDKVQKLCAICGKKFLAIRAHADRTLYCHLNCRQAAVRRRRKSGPR